MAALAIGGLVIGVIWFTALVVVIALQVIDQTQTGPYAADADLYMGLFSGMVFVLGGVALDVYRKEFMPDELIHKVRRPKIVYQRNFR